MDCFDGMSVRQALFASEILNCQKDYSFLWQNVFSNFRKRWVDVVN